MGYKEKYEKYKQRYQELDNKVRKLITEGNAIHLQDVELTKRANTEFIAKKVRLYSDSNNTNLINTLRKTLSVIFDRMKNKNNEDNIKKIGFKVSMEDFITVKFYIDRELVKTLEVGSHGVKKLENKVVNNDFKLNSKLSKPKDILKNILEEMVKYI